MIGVSGVEPLVGISLRDRIRRIVREQVVLGVQLEELKDSTDLYRAGMSSHSSVLLMVALENEFGIEFPDGMLNRDVFESVDSIAQAVGCVLQQQ